MMTCSPTVARLLTLVSQILILGQPGSPVEIRLARSHVSFNGSAGIAYSTILVRQSTPSSDLQSSVRKDEHDVAPGHQPQQEPTARQPELNTSQSVQATPTTSKHKTSGKSADRKNSIEPRAHVSPTRSPGEGSVVSLKSRCARPVCNDIPPRPVAIRRTLI